MTSTTASTHGGERTQPHLQGQSYTLEDFTFFEHRCYCLTCQTLIRAEECLCTGFYEEDEDA